MAETRVFLSILVADHVPAADFWAPGKRKSAFSHNPDTGRRVSHIAHTPVSLRRTGFLLSGFSCGTTGEDPQTLILRFLHVPHPLDCQALPAILSAYPWLCGVT